MMLKNKRAWYLLFLAVVIGVVLIYTYPRSLKNFVQPLKNGEEIEYIRVIGQKEETYIVEIHDEKKIASLKNQMEKVKLRYVRNRSLVKYSEENYLLNVHVNSPDYSFTIQKDGTLYCNDKQYTPVDNETLILFELLENMTKEELRD